jgi:PKD repeat protein
VQHVDLTFQAFDCDDYENGIGQLDVLVNGVAIVNIPAGLHHLTGSGDYLPYMDTRVTIGPIDIGAHLISGTNTIVFRNPLDNHECEVSHILIQSNGKTLLNSTNTREVEPNEPLTLTFSNPPLEITSLTITPTTVNKADKVTVTASYTGGTGPFECKFNFGDGSHATVQSNGQSCSTTHQYRKAGTFQVTVKIKGANTGDRASQSITVTVRQTPPHDHDHNHDVDDHHEDDHDDRICSDREKGHNGSDNDKHADSEQHA